jgi:hypothetical protein
MEHEAKLARLAIGLRGLGLLRQWPFGDAAEAEVELGAIADMVAHRDELPLGEVFHFDALDIADGYTAWSETYDEVGNPLVDVEQRALEPILSGIEPGNALDVGCGTGRVTAILCALGHRVVGVDPSEEVRTLESDILTQSDVHQSSAIFRGTQAAIRLHAKALVNQSNQRARVRGFRFRQPRHQAARRQRILERELRPRPGANQ